MVSDTSRWLPLNDGAALLGIATSTLRRWAAQDRVPSYRHTNGRRFFRRADLEMLRDGAGGRRPVAPPPGWYPPAPPLSDDQLLTLKDQFRRELDEMGSLLAEAVDLTTLVRILAERLWRSTDSANCDVWLIRGDTFRCLASRDPGGFDERMVGRSYELESFPLTAAAVASRQPLVVADLDDPRLVRAEIDDFRRWNLRSNLCLPLTVGDRVIGLLDLFDNRPRDYAEHIAFVGSVGAIISGAFQKAVILDQLEKTNSELRDLVAASIEFGAGLDLEALLQTIATRMRAAASATYCDIYGVEKDSLHGLISVGPDGAVASFPGRTYDLNEYTASRTALESHEPTVVEDVLADPRAGEAECKEWQLRGLRSGLLLPLITGARVVGMAAVFDTGPRAFERLDFLRGLSQIAAQAIGNANLYRRSERRSRQLASLLEASRTITSTLVLEDVLDGVARTTAEALGSPECLIYEYDQAADTVTVRSCYEPAAGPYADIGRPFPLADWPRDREVLERGTAVQDFVGDPGLDQATRKSMVDWDEKSALNVPFAFGGQPMGMLVIVETEHERHFSDEEVGLATALAEQAAIAISNAQTVRRLEQRRRETELLNEIARRITATLRVDEVAAATLDELRALIPFDRATLVLLDEDRRLTTVYASTGQQRLDGMPVDRLGAVFLEDLRRDKVLLLELPGEAPLGPDHPFLSGLKSGAAIGLFREGELIGALTLGSARDKAFSSVDRDVLVRIGTHLSLAIGNAYLYERIRRLHLTNLRALSSALSAKDYYTLGHAARVAAYVVLLGTELGWSDELITQVEEATYLHDIGKIAISDRVLLKPSRLNSREWDLMRQHPAFSADIIGALFAEEPVAGVRHHHERYDGAGYPDGLAGGDIPDLAAAMCVVDSYDAMSSWRPYRKALSFAECLAELDRCRGTQFDPDVVDTFLRVLRNIERKRALAERAAVEAAARIDPSAHLLLREPADEARPEYAEIAAALRKTRDANPPARFVTTIAPAERGHMIVVDAEEDPTLRSPLGEQVLLDDGIAATFAGEPVDANVLYVDEWGVWISGNARLLGENGQIVALVNVDLPADDRGRLEGLHGGVTETFASLVHSAAMRFSRAEVDAITDGLTGVFNHRYLHERLAEEVESAQESQRPLTMLFCDIDRFKSFNDRHGHSAGDEALRSVSQIIESSIRHGDVAARYGGEEFAVILVDTSIEPSVRIAERIRRRVARTRMADVGKVTVSIGVATLPEDADSAEQLLDRADWAMYQAKRRGRNKVATFQLERASAPPPDRRQPAVAPAPPALGDFVEARERYTRSRAEMFAQLAGAVAQELGLTVEATADVVAQARRFAASDKRAPAARRKRAGADGGTPLQVSGEVGDRVIAALAAYESFVTRHPEDGALGDEGALARLRKQYGREGDGDVLAALARAVAAED